MAETFDSAWAKVMHSVHPALTIKNWGRARGYTGGSFKIEHVSNGAILVFGGNMTTSRNISKADFEKVYSVWDEYVAGDYSRAEMTNLSQNTTYVLSILHHALNGDT